MATRMSNAPSIAAIGRGPMHPHERNGWRAWLVMTTATLNSSAIFSRRLMSAPTCAAHARGQHASAVDDVLLWAK
jgi:hypothetical protein